MATTIQTPQLDNLKLEFQTGTLIPKVIAEQLIQNAPVVYTIPFNTDGMPLNVTAGSGYAIAGPSQSIKTYCNASGKSGNSITAGTGVTVGTPTSGKTFYCTSITIALQGGAYNSFEVRDGGSGGTLKIAGGNCTGANSTNSMNFVFPTPMTFATNVWLDVGTTNTVQYCFNGFEA